MKSGRTRKKHHQMLTDWLRLITKRYKLYYFFLFGVQLQDIEF